MAANLDILIKAIDQASGPLGTVTNAVSGLGNAATGTVNKGLGQMRSFLGGALVAGAVAGGAALGGLSIAVGRTGIDFNNLKQQAEIAFTTMLGSGEAAKVFLDDLQDFAEKTPFEFPELLTASQRLLAMGFAAEDVRPTLTAVGDAVAGLGGSSALVDRVTLALGQMQAKGKTSAGEMLQLTEAGIPAWQMLADAIGVSIPEAMGMVSAGAVDADTTITALVNGMNERFGGMMEQQSQTYGGMLSNLQDVFTQVSGTIMKPLFDVLTDGLGKVVEWTSKPEFAAGVAAFAEALSAAVEKGVNFVADVLPKIWQFAQDIYDPLVAVAQAAADFGARIWELAQPVIDAVTEFVKWEDAIRAVALVMGIFAVQAIAGLLVALAPVTITLAAIVAGVALLRNVWERDWGGIQTKTRAVTDYLQTRFGELGSTIQAFGGDALREIRAFVTGNETEFTALGKIWDATKEAGRGLFTDIADSAKTIGQPFLDWFEDKFPGAAETARRAFADVSEKLQTLFDELGKAFAALRELFGGESGKINQILTQLKEWWDEHGAAVMRIIDNTFTTIFTIISGALQLIIQVITLVLQVLNGDWEEAWGTFKDILITIWDTIREVVRLQLDSLKTLILTVLASISEGAREKATEWVTSILTGLADLGYRAWQLLTDAISFMLSPMEGLWERFRDFGTNAVQGFMDGVGSLISQAQARVAELMALANQAAAAELDAHSPSRKWEQLGRWSGEGYIQGLASSLRGVGGAMADADRAAGQTVTTYNSFAAYVTGSGDAGRDVMRQIDFYNSVYGSA